jgi:glutathione S-transferase
MSGACSMAVHVILNELGQEVKLENVRDPSGGMARPPEFLKINPRGNVPTLVDDGHVIREGGAIITYLLDKHNSPMLPKSGKERATALEWLMFCNSTLHPAYGRVFFAKSLPADVQEKVIPAFIQNINKHWKDVESRLTQSEYLCGKECSAADILLTVIANWSGNFAGIEIGPKAKALFKKVIARPAYKKALEVEKVEYKAAA